LAEVKEDNSFGKSTPLFGREEKIILSGRRTLDLKEDKVEAHSQGLRAFISSLFLF